MATKDVAHAPIGIQKKNSMVKKDPISKTETSKRKKDILLAKSTFVAMHAFKISSKADNCSKLHLDTP